jgi:hypothetical protein
MTTTTGTYGHLALDDLRDGATRTDRKTRLGLLTDPARALPAPKRTENHPAMTACSRVSRLGIEPTTLGLTLLCQALGH